MILDMFTDAKCYYGMASVKVLSTSSVTLGRKTRNVKGNTQTDTLRHVYVVSNRLFSAR